MEYQSFFLILKSFSFENQKFISTNPNVAQGFVKIKKDAQDFSITIHINNFSNPAQAYLVCKTNVAKIFLKSATTIEKINFEINQDASIFIFDYNFFASKNCVFVSRDYQTAKRVEQRKERNTLEKIFGKVHDTYFFDCIKPQLAGLFAVGKPCLSLGKTIANSKWTMVNHNGEQMVFGVIYKDNFAYAVAVGSTTNSFADENAYAYKVEDKTYNILFMSASNGKFISF